MAGQVIFWIGVVLMILGIIGIVAAIIWNRNSPNVPTAPSAVFSTWTTGQKVLLWLSVLAFFIGFIMVGIGSIQWYYDRYPVHPMSAAEIAVVEDRFNL